MLAERSMKTFMVVWAGQLLSLIGSGLTGFGLGVWVFLETGSATQFAMIGLAAIVPAIVLSPFAGVYVDRWDRRKTMMFADLAAGLATMGIAAVIFFGDLQLWHILLTASVGSIASAFQRPAYTAAITQIVPKDKLGKAAGLVQLAEPLSTILAPILAGLLIGVIGLSGILVIDFVTFLFAMVTLTIVRFPKLKKKEKDATEKPSVLAEAKVAWQFIVARKGLFYMMIFYLLMNFSFGFAAALYAPLVLGFSGPPGLGTVMAMAGAGGIVGSILMGIWGGPKRKVHGILCFGVIAGLGMAVTGVRDSLVVVSISSFMMMLVVPIWAGSSQVLWQTKVPLDMQGRVFAFKGMTAMLAMPLAYLIAGPAADNLFEPGMAVGGNLSELFGPLVGVGKGRGIGLMFVISGVVSALISLAAFGVPRLRNIETELEDVIEDEPIEEESDVAIAMESVTD